MMMEAFSSPGSPFTSPIPSHRKEPTGRPPRSSSKTPVRDRSRSRPRSGPPSPGSLTFSPHAVDELPTISPRFDMLEAEIQAIGLDDSDGPLSPIAYRRDSSSGRDSHHISPPASSSPTHETNNIRNKMSRFSLEEVPQQNTPNSHHDSNERLTFESKREQTQQQPQQQVQEENGEEELKAAKHLLGASSRVFMEQLRGAAVRRKLILARSRDSLVAKEKDQREAIAAAKANSASGSDDEESSIDTANDAQDQHVEAASHPNHSFKARPVPASAKAGFATGIPKVQKRPSTIPTSPVLGHRRKSSFADVPAPDTTVESEMKGDSIFKARPLPRTTGQSGHAGQVGVLKVSKRPSTIPVSPNIGKKRTSTNHHRDSKVVQGCSSKTQDRYTFKAKPLPKTNGELGQGGLAGVSKVSKRSVTVPVSPLLGQRRNTDYHNAKKALGPISPVIGDLDKPEKTSREFDLTASSDLLGVQFLNNSTLYDENTPPTTSTVTAYAMHSSLRAQKRAVYDESRKQRETENDQANRRIRKQQIQALHLELCSLREKI